MKNVKNSCKNSLNPLINCWFERACSPSQLLTPKKPKKSGPGKILVPKNRFAITLISAVRGASKANGKRKSHDFLGILFKSHKKKKPKAIGKKV